MAENKAKKTKTTKTGAKKKSTDKKQQETHEYTNMPYGEFITRYNISPDVAMRMIYEGELYVVRDDQNNLLVPTFQFKRLGLEEDD